MDKVQQAFGTRTKSDQPNLSHQEEGALYIFLDRLSSTGIERELEGQNLVEYHAIKLRNRK